MFAMTFTVKHSRHCEGLFRSNPEKSEKLKVKSEKYFSFFVFHSSFLIFKVAVVLPFCFWYYFVILTVGKDPDLIRGTRCFVPQHDKYDNKSYHLLKRWPYLYLAR